MQQPYLNPERKKEIERESVPNWSSDTEYVLVELGLQQGWCWRVTPRQGEVQGRRQRSPMEPHQYPALLASCPAAAPTSSTT